MKQCLPLLLLPALGLTLLATTACEVDSANKAVRTVNVDVSGVYRATSNESNATAFLSFPNGGGESGITSLNLRQNGDQLEGVNNKNQIFRGTLGSLSGNVASFNLSGAASGGKQVTISGNISVGNGVGVMRATWIEPAAYGEIVGIASGPRIIENPAPVTNITATINP
jgi:hypothetical protein